MYHLNTRQCAYLILYLGVVLLCPLPTRAVSAETPSALQPSDTTAHVYRSPGERRDAGLGVALLDGVKLKGLLELEQEYARQRTFTTLTTSEKQSPVSTLQIGVEVKLNDVFGADIVLETEHDKRTHSRVDEALFEIDYDDWGLKAGKLYLPFGEFYSHFVTGPILEFAETRGTGLIVDYSIHDTTEIGAYLFASKVSLDKAKRSFDWGIFSETSNEDESYTLGLAYLSDLAESQSLSEEINVNDQGREVSAISAHALVSWHKLELSLEMIDARQSFTHSDLFTGTLRTGNAELTYYVTPARQVSIRLEHNRGLSEQPKQQWGVSCAWQVSHRMGIKLDYLHGKFAKQTSNIQDALDKTELLALQLFLEL